MSSTFPSVQRSKRKKKHTIVTSCRSATPRSKRHGRKVMANYALRSRRQSNDEIIVNDTSRLVRRPLSISSSTSSSSGVDEGDGSSDVVDLTRDRGSGNETRTSRREMPRSGVRGGSNRQSGSTPGGRNVLIIDSDEEILEMEMPPTPPPTHQSHTHTRNSKKRSSQSRTGGGPSSSDLICCEDLPSTDSTQPSNGKPSSSAVNSISPGKISSRSIIQCPICMETVQQFEKEGRQLMVTRCGHIFCDVCIRESAKAQRKCPSCRKPVNLRDGFHELFIT